MSLLDAAVFRRSCSSCVALALCLAAAPVFAQTPPAASSPAPPPPPPPSGFQPQYGGPGDASQPPPPPPGYTGGPPPAAGYPGGPPPPPGVYMGAGPEMALGPKKMPYDEGDPVPPGYHVDTSIRKGLVIGGAVTFGAIYLITALTAGLIQSVASSVNTDADEVTPLYIPVAGPFVAMSTLDAEGGGIVALALLGVGQAAGLGMFITGMAAQQSVLVRNDVGATQKPRIRVMPSIGKGQPGLSLVGSF